jgi:uncharacterized lipoprotein YmbA
MRVAALLAALVLPLLAACGRSTMAQYYVLTPRTAAATNAGGGQPRSLGIGPVSLPKYVDRDNIVTTVGAQEVRVEAAHLWAEPLEENFVRVLTENLSATLGTDDIQFYPWPAGAVDHQVTVEVVRFDGALNGDAFLQARWSVREGKNTIASRRSNLTRKAGADYNAFAAAMSEMIAELSAEIAKECR